MHILAIYFSQQMLEWSKWQNLTDAKQNIFLGGNSKIAMKLTINFVRTSCILMKNAAKEKHGRFEKDKLKNLISRGRCSMLGS